jgi:hypothetical protein
MSEYKQPISLMDFGIAIHESSDEQIHQIHERLQVSLHRLAESNKLMKRLMDKETAAKGVKGDNEENDDEEFNPVTEDDIKIYTESIAENERTIANQIERCKIIEEELGVRNLKVRHPQLDEVNDSTFPPSSEKPALPISTDNDTYNV